MNDKGTPEWVQPGVWAFSPTRDTFIRIIKKEPDNPSFVGIFVEVWRDPRSPRWVQAGFLQGDWTVCDAPREPLDTWNRLLEDDFLEGQ